MLRNLIGSKTLPFLALPALYHKMICGTMMLGEVDFTDTVFVGTTFFHIFFLPLCPMDSHLVVRRTYRSGCRTSFTGESLGGLEARSAGYGYLQGLARFSAFLCLILGIVEIYRVQSEKASHYMEYTLIWAGVILAPWLFLGIVNYLKGNRASPARVLEIRATLIANRKAHGRTDELGASNGTLAPLQTQVGAGGKVTAEQVRKNRELGEPLLPV